MADELLEAKVQVSGTEESKEAATDFAQSAQRMTAAVESLSEDIVGKGDVDRILTEAGLGPIQDIRRYTDRCRQEIDQIIKDFREIHQEAAGVDDPVKTPGGRRRRASWTSKIRNLLTKATGKLHLQPEQIAGDISKVVSNLTGMMIPSVMGAGAGSLLSLILFGVAETEKQKAEANRYVQIFEESIRGIGTKAEAADRSAAAELAKTAKDLEISFAATRGELEAVARAFATAGISSTEINEKITKSYGSQLHTLRDLTLGLERHFELAGGTAARQAAEMMNKYGMSNAEAGEAVVRLNFAGARSGVGLGSYTNAIMQAAAGVRHLGINTDQVITLTTKLQEQYVKMGLKDHFAGTEAVAAVQGILGGLANFSLGEQVWIAGEMGHERGLRGVAEITEELYRKGGPDPKTLTDWISAARKLALSMSHGDPLAARWSLMNKGFTPEGAKALIEFGDQLAKGAPIEKVAAEAQRVLGEALQTEAQKTESFQKFIKQALEGARKVGLALFNILIAGVAEQILSLRAALAILSGDTASAAAYIGAMKETMDVFPEALGLGVSGLRDVGGAAGEMFAGVKGLDPLVRAFEELAAPAPPPPPDSPRATGSEFGRANPFDVASGGMLGMATGGGAERPEDTSDWGVPDRPVERPAAPVSSAPAAAPTMPAAPPSAPAAAPGPVSSAGMSGTVTASVDATRWRIGGTRHDRLSTGSRRAS